MRAECTLGTTFPMVSVALPVSVEELSPQEASLLGKVILEKASALHPWNTLSDHKRLQLEMLTHAKHVRREDFAAFVALADLASLGLPGERLPKGEVLRGQWVLAYGHLSKHESSWGLESLANPEIFPLEDAVARYAFKSLFAAAVQHVASSGGGRLQIWLRPPRETQAWAARELGFSPGRTLLEMRLSLAEPASSQRPAPSQGGPTASDSYPATRAFRVGTDEDAWLEVNNAAFSDHPEQGNWDLDVLAVHEEEPWFDPEGFRILDAGGEMAGFCWTKIHSELDPPTGEIYAIAVNPAHQGKGFGRVLLQAGLEYLRARGMQVAMLFVEESNSEAVSLYRSLGFQIHWREQTMEQEIAGT
jgi:mycothiol synthase